MILKGYIMHVVVNEDLYCLKAIPLSQQLIYTHV